MKHFYNYLLPKKFFFLSVLLSVLSCSSFAQVGFNNPNPDSTALIDMKANDKGLLIPRMTTTDRDVMTAGGKKVAHALLVFDTDQNVFFVYDTIANPDKWVVLNPFQSPSQAGGNIGIATTSAPTEKLEVNGNVKANAFIGNGTIPLGGIIMWSGAVVTIPTGWALCDGTNGTPDLRQRFIVGAGGDNPTVVGTGYNPNNNGGLDRITLAANQSGLPAHTHVLNDPGHNHSINDPGHSHSINTSSAPGGSGEIGRLRDPNNGSNNTNPSVTGITINNNTTGITIQVTPAQNATVPFDNRPPYYALAFIMRVQ